MPPAAEFSPRMPLTRRFPAYLHTPLPLDIFYASD